MRKHYVLVAVEKPSEDTMNASQVWLSFQSKTEKITLKDEGSRRHPQSVWLLVRDSEASALARIVREAEGFGLKYEVLYLDSTT